MPQATTPPSNSWEPDSASGHDPTIQTDHPEVQPPEPPQPINGPLLRADGSWMTPGEAMAQAAGQQQQQDDLAQLGYPLWSQTKAQTPRPSS